MNELEILLIAKIDELDYTIEMVGKLYQLSGNEKQLDFIYRRIEARNKLELYLKSL